MYFQAFEDIEFDDIDIGGIMMGVLLIIMFSLLLILSLNNEHKNHGSMSCSFKMESPPNLDEILELARSHFDGFELKMNPSCKRRYKLAGWGYFILTSNYDKREWIEVNLHVVPSHVYINISNDAVEYIPHVEAFMARVD